MFNFKNLLKPKKLNFWTENCALLQCVLCVGFKQILSENSMLRGNRSIASFFPTPTTDTVQKIGFYFFFSIVGTIS